MLSSMEEARDEELCSNLSAREESEDEATFLEIREGYLLTLNILQTFLDKGEEEEAHHPIPLPGGLYSHFEDMAQANIYQPYVKERIKEKVEEFIEIFNNIPSSKVPDLPNGISLLHELLEGVDDEDLDYQKEATKLIRFGNLLGEHTLIREIGYLIPKINELLKEFCNMIIFKKLENENKKVGRYPKLLIESYERLSIAVRDKDTFNEIKEELRDFWDLGFAAIEIHKKVHGPP